MSTNELPRITEYTTRLALPGATHYVQTGFGYREVIVISEFTNSYGVSVTTARDNMEQIHQVRTNELIEKN